MPDNDTAVLRVVVTTALGSLPIENAAVRVSTAADAAGARELLYAVVTDRSGMIPPLTLSTPPLANSLAPDIGVPYTLYTVDVTAEGFTPVTALHVALFPGISAALPVVMTPVGENQSPGETDITSTGDTQALYPPETAGKE